MGEELKYKLVRRYEHDGNITGYGLLNPYTGAINKFTVTEVNSLAANNLLENCVWRNINGIIQLDISDDNQ